MNVCGKCHKYLDDNSNNKCKCDYKASTERRTLDGVYHITDDIMYDILDDIWSFHIIFSNITKCGEIGRK